MLITTHARTSREEDMKKRLGRRIVAAAVSLAATLGTTTTIALVTAAPAHACGTGGCANQR
ncbi:MAG: hypothetical protein NVSMB32_18790 [Actinomycetota bacterium]